MTSSPDGSSRSASGGLAHTGSDVLSDDVADEPLAPERQRALDAVRLAVAAREDGAP